MIETREFVERRIRANLPNHDLIITEAEIVDLVDKVMLRQQAKDAAEHWIGYHEHVCGNGEKEGHYVDGWLAGWAACKEFMNSSVKAAELVATNTRLDYKSLKAVLTPMEKQRDPRENPQVGDKIYKITESTGLRRSRQVVSRIDNDIVYISQDGKQKKCWIGTWMEWGRGAEVEPNEAAVPVEDVKALNAAVDGLAQKVINERKAKK